MMDAAMLDARPTTTPRDVQARRERGARQLAAVLDGLAGTHDRQIRKEVVDTPSNLPDGLS